MSAATVADPVKESANKNPVRRKRIGVDLLVISQFSNTGIVTYAREILPPLFRMFPEHDWILLTRPGANLGFDPSQFPNVRVKHSRWMATDWLWKLAGLIAESLVLRLDLLFLPVTRAPMIKTCPVIAFVHDVGFLTLPEFQNNEAMNRKTDMAHRLAIKKANVLLCNSEFTKSSFCSHYKVNPKNVAVTYYGFDETLFNTNRVDDREAEEILKGYGIRKPYVLYLGIIQGRKNLVKLIEASAIWRKTDPGLQLVLAGQRGWNCDAIYAAAEGYPAEQVIMTGAVKRAHLPTLYHHAECYVLPSIYEGFGIPVIESMACGTPAILSNRSALPEAGGSSALYFDPEKPEEIAARILELRSSDVLRRRMIMGGFERVKDFTWIDCAERTRGPFQGILNETA